MDREFWKFALQLRTVVKRKYVEARNDGIKKLTENGIQVSAYTIIKQRG